MTKLVVIIFDLIPGISKRIGIVGFSSRIVELTIPESCPYASYLSEDFGKAGWFNTTKSGLFVTCKREFKVDLRCNNGGISILYDG